MLATAQILDNNQRWFLFEKETFGRVNEYFPSQFPGLVPTAIFSVALQKVVLRHCVCKKKSAFFQQSQKWGRFATLPINIVSLIVIRRNDVEATLLK